MSRVLCDRSFPVERVGEELVTAAVDVEVGSSPWSGDDVAGLLTFEAVAEDDLARLPALQVIATPSIGFDHLDVTAATQRGVWVCNVPDYCIDEMADHALALLLALVRGVVELDRSVRQGEWRHDAAGPLGRIGDVRLGVVGFGRIGRAVTARARALEMDVAVNDPLVDGETIVAAGARPSSLDGLLRSSTVVSLHAPLTPNTRGLIGERELALLPPGAYLVNAARGGLVDTAALLRALESGRLAGAALDVLEVEPPVPSAPEGPRLIVTPHAGWYSERAEESAVQAAIDSVRDVLEGRRPRNAVNEPGGR